MATLACESGAKPLPSSTLGDRFCANPFQLFELGRADEAFVCCYAWLPTSIGSLGQGEAAEETWNSPTAQAIRRSILDGSFSFCRKDRCPKILKGTLPRKSEINDPRLRQIIDEERVIIDGPREVNFANDRSCNLSCPSCREEKIDVRDDGRLEKLEEMHEKLVVAFFDGLEWLLVSGSGDPFGSKFYRDFLCSLDGTRYPQLKIQLNTNGQLLTARMWDRLRKVHGNIERIFISFDAASEETYRTVRRGGSFDQLRANTEFVAGLRRSGAIAHLQLDFVVQERNFREMAEFVRLGERFGVDRVMFQKIVNWGTFSEGDFAAHAVWQDSHPEHAALREALRDPVFRKPFVDLGNLTEFAPIRGAQPVES